MTQEQRIRQMIASFLDDPADSDFQEGFLACAIVVAEEIMGIEWNDPLIEAAKGVSKPDAPAVAARAKTILSVIKGGKPDIQSHD